MGILASSLFSYTTTLIGKILEIIPDNNEGFVEFNELYSEIYKIIITAGGASMLIAFAFLLVANLLSNNTKRVQYLSWLLTAKEMKENIKSVNLSYDKY